MPRVSEIGYPENFVCIEGIQQRLREQITAQQRERRRKSPFLQPLCDIRIQSLQLLVDELENISNRGRQQISRKEFDELADRAELWRSMTVKLLNSKRNLSAAKSQLAKREAETEDLNKRLMQLTTLQGTSK